MASSPSPPFPSGLLLAAGDLFEAIYLELSGGRNFEVRQAVVNFDNAARSLRPMQQASVGVLLATFIYALFIVIRCCCCGCARGRGDASRAAGEQSPERSGRSEEAEEDDDEATEVSGLMQQPAPDGAPPLKLVDALAEGRAAARPKKTWLVQAMPASRKGAA